MADDAMVMGGPDGGRVAAVATGPGEAPAVFAGTRVGLFRASGWRGEAVARWERLADVSVEVLALAVSPAYARDHTLYAGTARGLYYSRDGGGRWVAARLPAMEAMVLSLACSPDYEADGIVVAGTLQDGILFSGDRGETWSYRDVGLLDATFYSLAISPDFAKDGTIYAGAETGLYYSYNGARAWKQLDFPEEAAPVLSLAVSPGFARDGTLYAGTERQGLYRSADRGRSWERLDVPGACVNALAWRGGGATNQASKRDLVCCPSSPPVLLAATDAGVYASDDGGESWAGVWEEPDVLCLAGDSGALLAGMGDDGVWMGSLGPGETPRWQPIFAGPARPLLGMALSPRFAADPVAYLYGPQEGIWRTVDGGETWECLDEALPTLDIRSLAISPRFDEDRVLVAASAAGVLLSGDGGDSWAVWSQGPAALVTCSPTGGLFAAVAPDGAVRVARAAGGPWESLPGPWDGGKEVLALAIDDDLRCRAALQDRAEGTQSLWEGHPGNWRRVLSRPSGESTLAAIWPPDARGKDEPWYAALGHEVWELRRMQGASATQSKLAFAAPDREPIAGLVGVRGPQGTSLLACAGKTIYCSTDGNAWAAVQHLDEHAVAVALSPDYARDRSVFALLLGGAVWRGSVGGDGGYGTRTSAENADKGVLQEGAG